MHHGTAGLSVTFNGEIYNYLELREQLRSAGHFFSTDSDTEVLLAAYANAGAAALDDLRGMFAFALWDETTRTLTLARDRIGKKPLYYTIENSCLYFSSCLDALYQTRKSRWTPSSAAVSQYLALGYIPAPLTIYHEAKKLEAGTTLSAGPCGLGKPERYWRPAADLEPFTGTFAQACNRTEELLQEAVRIRLRSDVPLGIFLSGGIDSSLVAAVAGHECGADVQTYAVGFDVGSLDESGHAAAVAESLGTDHRTIRVDPDVMSLLPEFCAHAGEPLASPSALPLWALAAKARQHATVILGGDGGDELFAGYSWYHTAARLERVRRFAGGDMLQPARGVLASSMTRMRARSGVSRRAQRALDAFAPSTPSARFAQLRVLFSKRDFAKLSSRDVEYVEAFRVGSAAFDDAGGDRVRRMRAADIATYLAESLMPKVDVATMSHALELRAPLLDHVLLEWALTLPEHILVDRRGGKRVLRALLDRYVPARLTDRPKQGFSVPLDSWFRERLAERANRLGRSDALEALGLRLSGVAELHAEHLRGERDHGERLFALLVLDEWARAR